MTPEEYRKQIESEIDDPGPRSRRATRSGGNTILQGLQNLDDQTLDGSERLQALLTLKAESFDIVKFAPHRAAFLESLRKIVRSVDTKDSLLAESISILSEENDIEAQELLKAELESAASGRLSTEVALRLLVRYDHSNSLDIAKKWFAKSEQESVKIQSLRIFASSGEGSELLGSIVMDQSQAQAVRVVAATALQAVDPSRFNDLALELAQNTDEDDALKFQLINIQSANLLPDSQTQNAELQKQLNALTRGSTRMRSEELDKLSRRIQSFAADEPRTRSAGSRPEIGTAEIRVTK